MIINISQPRVPIVFAKSIAQLPPTVTRTKGNFSLGSLKDVFVSPDVQTGDGIFYDGDEKKWISQSIDDAIVPTLIDGGTY